MGISPTEVLILGVLQQGELYGRQIAESVKELTGARKEIRKGTLYTTLHRMKQKGLVTSRWGAEDEVVEGARRKYYQITALGADELKEIKGNLRAVNV